MNDESPGTGSRMSPVVKLLLLSGAAFGVGWLIYNLVQTPADDNNNGNGGGSGHRSRFAFIPFFGPSFGGGGRVGGGPSASPTVRGGFGGASPAPSGGGGFFGGFGG